MVARYESPGLKKEFVPYHLVDDYQWEIGSLPSERPLFDLDKLFDENNQSIWIVEGEKCASALQSIGLTTTTSSGGSQAVRLTDWTPLSGKRELFILPDQDEAGETYAKKVEDCLGALKNPPKIRIVRLSGLQNGEDIVDWIQKELPSWDGYEEVPEKAAPFIRAKLEKLLFEKQENVEQQAIEPVAIDSAWPLPISLDNPVVCEWPKGVFPEAIENYVYALGAATETPIDLPAMLVLSVLSTAVQGKYQIGVAPGYIEPLNLWVCVALPSGNRKSSIIKAITHPLIRWETEQDIALEPEIQKVQSLRKTQEERIKKLRSKSTGKEGDAWDEACQEIWNLEAELPELPKKRQLWTTDITPENLGDKLAENHETMAVISDEGGIFDLMAGRYSRGIPNLDVFLQGHSGSSSRVNRKGKEAVTLHAPALTFGLSPQPTIIESLASKPGFRGRGLIARFLYSVPNSMLGYRSLEAPAIPEHLIQGYENVIFDLLHHPFVLDEKRIVVPKQLQLSEEAYTLWQAFAKEIEANMREEGMFAHITDWAGKLPGAIARICGNLHLAQFAGSHQFTSSIDATTMEKAIRIGRALGERALLAFNLMGADSAIEGAKVVLKWIKRFLFKEFTFRDCFKGH